MVKNPSADAGDAGSIPGSGRYPGEGNGNPLQYSWEISWTEEPGGLQSTGSKRDTVWQLNNSNNFLRLPGKVSFPIKEREIRGNVSLLPSFLPPSP